MWLSGVFIFIIRLILFFLWFIQPSETARCPWFIFFIYKTSLKFFFYDFKTYITKTFDKISYPDLFYVIIKVKFSVVIKIFNHIVFVHFSYPVDERSIVNKTCLNFTYTVNTVNIPLLFSLVILIIKGLYGNPVF